jgi:PHD/YefM family antitoxin component YafN of YafNO toxin-antitoxin module
LQLLVQEKSVSSSTKPAFIPIAKLPRTPASDLKKLGWRGMMSALRTKGTLLVTNHDEPEAVILSVLEYDALMVLVEQLETQTELALAGLRQSFDDRLSGLQERSAADRLRSIVRNRARLNRKVKAGSGH